MLFVIIVIIQPEYEWYKELLMLYDSKAVLVYKFKPENYVGWEYKLDNGLIYLRKNLDNDPNLTDKGWKEIKE